MMNRNRSSSLSRLNMPVARNRSSSLGSRTSTGSFVRRGTSSFMEPDKCSGMKDPRPLNDKGFQTSCVRKLVEFLAKNNYPRAFNQRMLVSPITKVVNQIFEFIYNLICPGFQLATESAAEDIIYLVKCLEYPFQLKKQSLQKTAYGGYNWGEVLVMLVWLTEFVELHQHMSTTPQDIMDGRCDAILQSYHRYLRSGRDDDDELLKAFENRVAIEEAMQKLSTLEKEEELGQKELEDIEIQERNLQMEVQEKEQLLKDMEALKKYIQDMTKYLPSKVDEYEQMVAKHNEQLKAHKALTDKADQLEVVLLQQKEKGQSNQLILKNRLDKVECLNREEDRLKKLEDQSWNLEMEQSQLQRQVNEVFRNINNTLIGENLPAEFSFLKEFEARFPGSSAEQLEEINSQRQALCKHARKENMSLDSKLLKQNEYLMELEHQIHAFEEDRNEIEHQINEENIQHKEFLAKINLEIEALEGQKETIALNIDHLKKRFHDIAEIEKRFEEAELELKDAQETKNKRIKSQEEAKQASINRYEMETRPYRERYLALLQQALQKV